MASVKLSEISRQYGNTIAIEDITFTVPDGQFWVLVGPSGCGKSTILRTIAGLDAITRGSLYIGDRLMNDVPARQRDVAMVFQNYALYPHFNVAENLAFGLRMRKQDEETIKKRVMTVANSLALEHLLDRKPKQLSGGQQQRVALGRAIAREPQLFLLDEPLSNLDTQLRDNTRSEIKQLHQRLGITTLYVTHDQTEAMTLGDCLVVLSQGHIQQIGTPQEVYDRPTNAMVANFLGNPPMNLLPATYNEGKLRIASQNLPCPLPLQAKLQPGQTFDLGIRAEHLTLADSSPLTIGARVVLKETLGREKLIKANILDSDISLNFYIPREQEVSLGETINLDLGDRFFAFAKPNGERIT